jgi:hypothetical protein
MKSMIRLGVVSALAAGLVACGGGAKLAAGKENAAAALFMASGPSQGARGGLAALAAGQASIDANGEIPVNCEKGGKAVMKFDLSSIGQVGEGAGNLAYTMTYQNCSQVDGINMNGTMNLTLKYNFDQTDASANGTVELTLKGRVDFSGKISDFVDADVKQTIDFNALEATSGSVSLTLDGKITTSSGTYTYANETLTVTAGQLAAAEAEASAETDG